MNRTLIAFLVLAFSAPALAGCLADDPTPTESASVAANAAEAGAVSGAAPSAAKAPYQLPAGETSEPALTLYPMEITTTAAKAPYANEFTGLVEPYQCLPSGGSVPLLGLVAGGRHFHEVTEAFATNDVFSYTVTMRFTNTDDSWAELHLWNQFDDVNEYWNEPVSDQRGEIVQTFEGQGFIRAEEFFAGVGVDCWYGSIRTPITYSIAIAVTFAEGGVPSGVPVLVDIPAGATKLFITGLALDDAKPVTSHFRLFAPNDALVCECTLNSAQTVSIVDLAEPGAYVLLVDHTEAGFVALALDAPPTTKLQPLGVRWERMSLVESDGAGVDEVLQIDLPSTPLQLWAWTRAPGDFNEPNAGGGRNLHVTVSNARGDALRIGMVTWATYHAGVPGVFATNNWYAVPLEGDWEFFVDHHAYDLGPQTVTVRADELRGSVEMLVKFYDRES